MPRRQSVIPALICVDELSMTARLTEENAMTEEKPMTMNIPRAQTWRDGDRFWCVMAAATATAIAIAAAGCSSDEARTPEPRPVRALSNCSVRSAFPIPKAGSRAIRTSFPAASASAS